MKVILLLSAIVKFLGRALDKLDEYDAQRKQLQREERRASISENPDEAFADLFGESSNDKLHQPINLDAKNLPVRSKLSTINVDKNGKRTGDNA